MKDEITQIYARILFGCGDFNLKVYVPEPYIQVFGAEGVPKLVKSALDQYRAASPDARFAVGVPYAFYDVGQRPIEGIHIFRPVITDQDTEEDRFDTWTMEDGLPVERETDSEEIRLILRAERIAVLTAKNTARYARVWPEIEELGLQENGS